MSQVEARLKTLAGPIIEATIPPNIKPSQQEIYLKRTFDVQMAANGLSSYPFEIPAGANGADGDRRGGIADRM